MVAAYTILRAAAGYLFLVFVVRTVGRRPGKQLTAFEYVLIFYLGGLALTGIVGDEFSLTSAILQILTVAGCHYALSTLRRSSAAAGKLLDGIPITLLTNGQWHPESMRRMRLQDDDVMAVARDQGLETLNEIDTAVLETYGEITVIPKEQS